jgi:hypothetical protein
VQRHGFACYCSRVRTCDRLQLSQELLIQRLYVDSVVIHRFQDRQVTFSYYNHVLHRPPLKSNVITGCNDQSASPASLIQTTSLAMPCHPYRRIVCKISSEISLLVFAHGWPRRLYGPPWSLQSLSKPLKSVPAEQGISSLFCC